MSSDDADKGLLRKLVSRNAQLTQQELETLSHWLKQFAALMHGFTCGTMPMVGMNAFLSFSVVMMIVTWIVSRFTRDEMEPEQHLELVKEGFVPATGLFLLTYILSYTFAFH